MAKIGRNFQIIRNFHAVFRAKILPLWTIGHILPYNFYQKLSLLEAA